jgi:glycosyltransferase involved in cell wall biosynthesis
VKAFSFKAIKKIGNADIIIPTDSGWESILTRFWAWRNNARVVIIGHSGKGWDDRINLLTRPDVFVTLSDFQAKWARKNAFGVRVTKIPNGIDLDRFNPGVKPISIDLPRPIVLCVGALEPNKRVDLTIRAVARMKKGSLLAIGDGQSREEIIQLGNRLLPGRFRQLRTSYADMPRYYTATDVFTLPTVWWEPFGLVYLEAMACGLPVVAPNDPIRREIVGNGGLFVDPINTDAYARALLRALSMDWGQSPLFQAQKFSWDRVASQYEDLFRSII